MEARTVNNLPPAAPQDDAVRCLLAIELSKESWVIAVNTPLSHKISRYTLKPCDAICNERASAGRGGVGSGFTIP
jgi:transposase